MISHLVAFAPDPSKSTELGAVMVGLNALTDQIEGFVAFTHGPNIDAESKTPGHPYGFICTFTNRAALDRYASDPRHQALGARLVALCPGGGDSILVYDIDDAKETT